MEGGSGPPSCLRFIGNFPNNPVEVISIASSGLTHVVAPSFYGARVWNIMEKATKKSVRRWTIGLILLAILAFFIPLSGILLSGLRHLRSGTQQRILKACRFVEQYFFGDGFFTWLLSPSNILLDILSLPYISTRASTDWKPAARLSGRGQKADCGDPGREHSRAIAGACRTAEPSHVSSSNGAAKTVPSFTNVQSFYGGSDFSAGSHSAFSGVGPGGLDVGADYGPIRATIRVLSRRRRMSTTARPACLVRRHDKLLEGRQTVSSLMTR